MKSMTFVKICFQKGKTLLKKKVFKNRGDSKLYNSFEIQKSVKYLSFYTIENTVEYNEKKFASKKKT